MRRGRILLMVLAILAVALATSDVNWRRLWISLTGGSAFVYRVVPHEESTADPAQLVEETRRVLRARLDGFGMTDVSVTGLRREQILIGVPRGRVEEISVIRSLVERPGVLNFHLIVDRTEAAVQLWDDRKAQWNRDYQAWRAKKRSAGSHSERLLWAARRPAELAKVTSREFQKDSNHEYLRDRNGNKVVLRSWLIENTDVPRTRVSGELLASASTSVDELGNPAVAFTMTRQGGVQFGQLTASSNANKSLAMVLDGEILSVANIASTIYVRGQLTGSFTDSEVKQIVAVISGRLPARLELVVR